MATDDDDVNPYITIPLMLAIGLSLGGAFVLFKHWTGLEL